MHGPRDRYGPGKTVDYSSHLPLLGKKENNFAAPSVSGLEN